jgi:hypothetical protein
LTKQDYNRKYYAEHREGCLVKAKRWRKRHPERSKASQRRTYLKYREKRLAYAQARSPQVKRDVNRKARQKLKRKVIEAYGGKCSCCGETRIEFLTVEHVNHDGAAHRKLVGAGAGMYRDLLRRGCPKDGFTVFCWNCQMATRYGDECPHKRVSAACAQVKSALAGPG